MAFRSGMRCLRDIPVVGIARLTRPMVVLLGRNGAAKGFTLIEVMVTLFISSVGLLGLAGLQLHALQYAHSSYQRTLVNIQALDMAERMWTHLAEPLAELEEWRNLNQPSLPEWNGVVTIVPGQPSDYLITISWMNHRFNDSQAFSFSYRLRLPKLD